MLGVVGLTACAGLLVAPAIVLFARNWYDRILLCDYMANPGAFNLRDIVPVRERLGSAGTAMLRSALEAEREPFRRGSLAVLLPICDTNRLLPEALHALEGTHAGWRMAEALEGRMDEESREIVQNLAENSEGDMLEAALLVLVKVADDERSLRIAEAVLGNPAHSDRVWVAAINLLGNAAYYNNAAEAVDDLKPILGDATNPLRANAILALQSIPGEEAARLLREIAANSGGDSLRQLATDVLRERERILGVVDIPRPRGWKSRHAD